ncbi:MAG TPA: glycosyltransferase family 4 protein [Verrucomicrobiae bacterium]|jgi:glycosyltransferase involved in cell wall biosynthesis
MHFLLLNQFYAPDVAPTGQYLHDLAQALTQRGHSVKVLCSRRSYNGTKAFPSRECMEGVEVVRLPATGFGRRGFGGKIVDYASFYILLFYALMFERKRPDLILSLTTPPYIGLLAKIAAKRHRCRYVHWIMDLYPDVMFAHGMAGSNGLFSRFLRKLTRFQFKGADQVIALGPKMAERVSSYCDSQHSAVSWIPLWTNLEPDNQVENETNPLRAKRGWADNEVVFLYSGNMGLGHRFNEFLRAAKQLGHSKYRWAFAGDGKRREEIGTFAKANPSARIEFPESVPYSQLRTHLCSADVHLASMDSAWQGTMVPSKLQGSFAVGRPVLYVGGRDCETALWIQQSGGGWVVDENDLQGLLGAIEQAGDPDERRGRGKAALEFARRHFVKSAGCARFIELLENGSSSQTKQERRKTEMPKVEIISAF